MKLVIFGHECSFLARVEKRVADVGGCPSLMDMNYSLRRTYLAQGPPQRQQRLWGFLRQMMTDAEDDTVIPRAAATPIAAVPRKRRR
jgi:hypothetical protein